MVNTNKLKALIIENGMTQKQVADLMGMTISCFNQKINNKRHFKLTEITKMCELLKVSVVEDRFNIFFAEIVDYNQQNNDRQ